MNIQAMMKQAQQMQKDMLSKKEEINSMQFEGNSSIVSVIVNGKKELIKVNIDREDFEIDDLDMLEDMLVAALNDAFSKVDGETKKKLGNLQGMEGLL